MPKVYLGDSVYVDYDTFGYTLTTENGYGPSNTIYLDSEVLNKFLTYVSGTKDSSIRKGSLPEWMRIGAYVVEKKYPTAVAEIKEINSDPYHEFEIVLEWFVPPFVGQGGRFPRKWRTDTDGPDFELEFEPVPPIVVQKP